MEQWRHELRSVKARYRRQEQANRRRPSFGSGEGSADAVIGATLAKLSAPGWKDSKVRYLVSNLLPASQRLPKSLQLQACTYSYNRNVRSWR